MPLSPRSWPIGSAAVHRAALRARHDCPAAEWGSMERVAVLSRVSEIAVGGFYLRKAGFLHDVEDPRRPGGLRRWFSKGPPSMSSAFLMTGAWGPPLWLMLPNPRGPGQH